MKICNGKCLAYPDDPDTPEGSLPTVVQIGVRCIRESAPEFGKWYVTVDSNFGGWMTEDEIRKQFREWGPGEATITIKGTITV